MKKERLHLAMPPKTRQLLEKLQKRIGSGSITEVIRKSIALLDIVSVEQEKGSKLFFHDAAGKQTRIRFL